jgi:hypothetical protein
LYIEELNINLEINRSAMDGIDMKKAGGSPSIDKK